MSFGFSVGDFVAGAQLAYTLCQALSDTRGSASEYQELIAQLNVVHKVLLQVDQLRAAKQLAQATVNALLFTVNCTNETMETFLDHNEAYNESLKPGGSGNVVKDLFRKGKWATHMSENVKNLKISLATMLAAINCLVSLACYYNTEYDPRCYAAISPNYDSLHRTQGNNIWRDVKVEASIHHDYFNSTKCPGFEQEKSPRGFFRPGQIFATQMDFGRLPLKPIPKLRAVAGKEYLEDQGKRLAQIRKLPLKQMILYCKDLPLDRGKVECLLCKPPMISNVFGKDEWAAYHFRLYHWQYYFSMLPESASSLIKNDKKEKLIPRQELAKSALGSRFSADEWIVLTDATNDKPIETDGTIIDAVNDTSLMVHYLAGPVMIQRFVVVREGERMCLCLGIHTYARNGCVAQPDQELFTIVHSSKEVPLPLVGETGMVLFPIRMKPEHPSTALPRSARIHFGRSYEIDHDLPVQPLGLVHPASMETLLDQFEAKVFRKDKEQKEDNSVIRTNGGDSPSDSTVGTADMEVAKEIRQNIIKVLGSELSPENNQPWQGYE